MSDRLRIEAGAAAVPLPWLWPGWALLNLAAFAAALFLPLVKLSQLYIFSKEIVLVHLPLLLFKNDEWLLAILVGVLGIVTPVGKTLLFCAAPWRPGVARIVGALTPLSFFDIFMAALLIFIAKGALATDATTGIGIYPMVFFAVSSKIMEWRFGKALAATG